MPEVKEGQELIDTEVLRLIADTESIVSKFAESEDYKRLVENSEKFRKLVADDDEVIKKEGKSKMTFEQRRLLITELCAIGALDACVANLGNISSLHYHVEYSIEDFKRDAEKTTSTATDEVKE